MAKFVKLEDGNYVNIDYIRFIGGVEEHYAILDSMGNGARLTKKDLDNILKASECDENGD